jgi:hypothetical protein
MRSHYQQKPPIGIVPGGARIVAPLCGLAGNTGFSAIHKSIYD